MNRKLEFVRSHLFRDTLRHGLVNVILESGGRVLGEFSPICHKPKTCIFFLYRNSDYYMRTPAVTYSADFVPMLRVLRNRKYKAYMDIYALNAEYAKELIEIYAHRGGRSVRSRMRQEVAQGALYHIGTAAFMRMEGEDGDGVYDDDIYYDEDYMLETLMELFPCEQLLDIAASVRASRDINRRSSKTFLRNNTTDQTL